MTSVIRIGCEMLPEYFQKLSNVSKLSPQRFHTPPKSDFGIVLRAILCHDSKKRAKIGIVTQISAGRYPRNGFFWANRAKNTG